MHALRCQLHRRDQRTAKGVGEFQQGAESGCSDAGETAAGKNSFCFNFVKLCEVRDVSSVFLQVTTSCPVPSTQWPTKSSKTSKSIPSNTRPRHHVESSDSSSMSASMQSSPHSQITHGSRSKGASANNSVASKTQISQIDNRQQQQQPSLLEVDQSCVNYIEQTPYATVNLQPVVSTGFAAPTAPIISTLPTHEVMQQL